MICKHAALRLDMLVVYRIVSTSLCVRVRARPSQNPDVRKTRGNERVAKRLDHVKLVRSIRWRFTWDTQTATAPRWSMIAAQPNQLFRLPNHRSNLVVRTHRRAYFDCRSFSQAAGSYEMEHRSAGICALLRENRSAYGLYGTDHRPATLLNR